MDRGARNARNPDRSREQANTKRCGRPPSPTSGGTSYRAHLVHSRSRNRRSFHSLLSVRLTRSRKPSLSIVAAPGRPFNSGRRSRLECPKPQALEGRRAVSRANPGASRAIDFIELDTTEFLLHRSSPAPRPGIGPIRWLAERGPLGSPMPGDASDLGSPGARCISFSSRYFARSCGRPRGRAATQRCSRAL
jgi:hypothetical protein